MASDPGLRMSESYRQYVETDMATMNKMAGAAKGKVEAPAAAKPEDDLTPAVVITPTPVQNSVMVIVVGAGGNGARVVPPMMQMLRPGDRVVVMDHDIVEDRNLARQHFTQRDIGSPKALVLADRYKRPGIEIAPYQMRLEAGKITGMMPQMIEATNNGENRGHGPERFIFVGCVDGSQGRRAIGDAMRELMIQYGIGGAWIDLGNDMRGGQALLSLLSWRSNVASKEMKTKFQSNVTMPGMEAMPQLLRETEEEKTQAGCGDRLDIQTVQVNAMAASAGINILSWLLLGIPFQNAGVFFNTGNAMQPIKIERWLHDRHVAWPELRFAIPA